MNIEACTILGWEALSRGPSGSHLQSPAVLFETAEQVGKLFALEKICREKAIRGAGSMRRSQKLFLNIHPRTMADPEFTPGKTMGLLESAGLSAANIVFEVTERHSIHDFDLFCRTLSHYRNQGFQVALDDAGTGYSNLSALAALQPEYIKLDKSLIADIHQDRIKRALVETLVTFAEKIGSVIICEGLETREQLVCVKSLGAHYGQGYHLARPANPRPGLSRACVETFHA